MNVQLYKAGKEKIWLEKLEGAVAKLVEQHYGTETRVTHTRLEELLSKLTEVDLQQVGVEVDEDLLDAVGDQQQLTTCLGTLKSLVHVTTLLHHPIIIPLALRHIKQYFGQNVVAMRPSLHISQHKQVTSLHAHSLLTSPHSIMKIDIYADIQGWW